MLKHAIQLCTLMLLAAALSINAAQQQQSLYSKVLDEHRKLTIYLPDSYAADSAQKYPVMYLLDGPQHIEYTASIMQHLNRLGYMPELLIVGIANTDRSRDLTPSKDQPFAPTAGGANNFLDFLEKELIPFVDKKYPTADFRILTGHSFGGLFVMHSLSTRPQLFNAHFAFSPSLQWSYPETPENVYKWLENPKGVGSYLYMSIGNEGGNMHKGWEEVKAALEKKAPKHFTWDAEYYPDETHGTVPIVSLFKAYRGLFADWAVDFEVVQQGLDAIIAAYDARGKAFGLNSTPDESAINNAGYYFLDQPDGLEKARELFAYNIKHFPKSSNAYDSMADLLEKQGKMKEALKTMKQALKVADKKDINYAYLQEHHDRLKAAVK